jgi:hypothetical protein
MDSTPPPTEPIVPAATPAPAAAVPSILSGKVPASASFIIGILLFLMPFVNIKCGDTTLKQVSGVELATGFEMKDTRSNNSLFNSNDINTSFSSQPDTRRGNNFAIAAMLLGLVAAIVALLNFKGRAGLGLVLGTATVVALIALMIDIKSKIKSDSPPAHHTNSFDMNLGNNVNIVAEFTPYFYLAVLLFALGAYFSYKQRTAKT